MINLAPGTKVYLACRPLDLRNGFDGLAAKVQQMIGADPFSGHPINKIDALLPWQAKSSG